MSIVSALSKLLIKMGGTPATGDTSDELVDKIADAYAPGGGALVVHEGEGHALDKTWQEIYDAGFSVLELPIPIGGKTYGVLSQIVESDGEYAVIFVTLGDSLRPQIYVANSVNGYPVYTAT